MILDINNLEITRPVIVSNLDYFKSVRILSALLNSITCFTDKYRDRENMQQQILVEIYNLERKTSRDIHLIGLRFPYFLWIKPSSVTYSIYEYIKRKNGK